MWRHLITSRHQQRHSPCNKSSISPVHNKLKSNVFHCSVHTMHQTRVSNIEPSSRHIPDRDLCSVHMESQCNKFYSGQFLFLFISTYCKKNQKKIKTRTELVSEKFPNAEKSCCVQYTECIMVRFTAEPRLGSLLVLSTGEPLPHALQAPHGATVTLHTLPLF